MAIIAFHEITKQFPGTSKPAVDAVTFEVREGSTCMLVGTSGSGKTTLLRMLCGLLQPTAGTAVVLGEDVVAKPDVVKECVGYMSQRFGLYDDLTVEENLRFYAEVYCLHGARKHERIRDMIALAGLERRTNQLAGTLSGGWKQRLALGCSVVHSPELLLLDEPTAGVDPASRRRFWRMIDQLTDVGTTVLVTTHYMDEAERFRRVAFMSSGRLIAVGAPADVVARQPGAYNLEDVFVKLQEEDEARSVSA